MATAAGRRHAALQLTAEKVCQREDLILGENPTFVDQGWVAAKGRWRGLVEESKSAHTGVRSGAEVIGGWVALTAPGPHRAQGTAPS